MTKRDTTFFKTKAKTTKGLRKGSFTPLQVERSKSLSISVSSIKDLKSSLPAIKKPVIIPETQGSNDTLQFSQEKQGHDNNVGENNSIESLTQEELEILVDSDPDLDQIMGGEFLSDMIPSTYDLKCNLPVIRKPMIIPETQASDDDVQASQKEQKCKIVEHKNPSKSCIDSQEELEILSISDSDSDKIMDDDILPNVIPGTCDTLKKKFGAGGNAKFLKKKKDSKSAKVNINKPPTVNADARTLCTIDVSVGKAIEAKARELNYKPTKNDEQKLAALRVKMRHAVLPQHTVESAAGTRTMNDSERVSFETHAKLKRGSFNMVEDKKIKDNWNTFCQDNQWDPEKPEPFLLMSHNNNKKFLMHHLENRKNFVRCLAHGLPNRCLYSVYQRFRNLYGGSNKKMKNYTHKEDQQILRYVAAYPRLKAVNERDHHFANLATVMKRTRSSVYRRYRLLKKY